MATMDPQFTHAKLLEAASLLRLPVGVLVERLELTPDVFRALPTPPPPRPRVNNPSPDARATSHLDGLSLAHDVRPSSYSWPLDQSQTSSPGTGSSGLSLETWSDPAGLFHPHVPPRVRMTAATPPPPSPSGRAHSIHSDWVHVMSRVAAAASLPRDAASNGSDMSEWIQVRDGSPISSATLVTASADHVSPRFVSPMHSRRTSPVSHPDAGRTPESQPSSTQPGHAAAGSDSQGLVLGGHHQSALTDSRGGSGSPGVGETPSLGPCSKVWELPPVCQPPTPAPSRYVRSMAPLANSTPKKGQARRRHIAQAEARPPRCGQGRPKAPGRVPGRDLEAQHGPDAHPQVVHPMQDEQRPGTFAPAPNRPR